MAEGGFKAIESIDRKIDKEKVRQILYFLLSGFRSKLSVTQIDSNCPFDFNSFLNEFKSLNSDPSFSFTLEFVLQNGLLDSLIPYLKSSFKQNNSKKGILKILPPPPPVLRRIDLENEMQIYNQPMPIKVIKDKPILKEDPDIIIHVYDEGKEIWEDFKCKQSVLTKGMGYFSRVTVKGQNLIDMDISVHCEIKIFDWLLKWIQSSNPSEKICEINALNVIGLIVSSEFLQMSTLTSICIQYILDHIQEIVKNSPNLGCLSDSLIIRLSNSGLSNKDLEWKVYQMDKMDRITSRFYVQFIIFLNYAVPNSNLGHFSSTITLFKCKNCKQLLTNENSARILCRNVNYDYYGRQYSIHSKDPDWSLINFIRDLKRGLKTWRRVYWRLWGMVHFFSCLSCNQIFPARFSGTCKYHPNSREEINNDLINQNTSPRYFTRRNSEQHQETPEKVIEVQQPIAIRKFPCCQAPVYKFNPTGQSQGCQNREHVPDMRNSPDPMQFEIFSGFRELISENVEVDIWKNIRKFREKSPKIAILGSALEKWKSQGSFDCISSPDDDEDEPESGIVLLRKMYGFGKITIDSPKPGLNDLWNWNPDLTTRYNQDMQREMEEKYMINLAINLTSYPLK